MFGIYLTGLMDTIIFRKVWLTTLFGNHRYCKCKIYIYVYIFFNPQYMFTPITQRKKTDHFPFIQIIKQICLIIFTQGDYMQLYPNYIPFVPFKGFIKKKSPVDKQLQSFEMRHKHGINSKLYIQQFPIRPLLP